MFAFMLALVFIYLVLAAQFESFRDPLIIMLTVPLALIGAMVRLVVFRADHEHFQPNRYHHVGRIGFKERNLDRGIRQPAETGRLVHA